MNYLRDDFINLIGLSERLIINIGWNPFIKDGLEDQMGIQLRGFISGRLAYDIGKNGVYNALGIAKDE